MASLYIKHGKVSLRSYI